MKFCSQCGNPVTQRIPEGDSRLRFVCDSCQTIHYQNPNIVAGCLPTWGTQVLLCRRAIEPRRGYWTLPAGFMENDETTAAAAIRETVEEAGANIELGPLFSMLNVAHVHQVHLFYLARLIDLDYAAGIESLDVQMFSEREIPWADLAFPTIRTTLELFFADRRKVVDGGAYGFHEHDIVKPMRAHGDAPHDPARDIA